MRILLVPARLLYTVYGFALVAATSIAFGLFYRLAVVPWLPGWIDAVPRAWGRFTLALLTRCELRGLENLPDGPCALLANHASFLDIPLVQSLPRNVRFVAKRLFARLPAFGIVIRTRGDIVVDKTAGGAAQDSRAVRESVAEGCGAEVLALWKEERRDRVLVVYAEGTRSRDGQLRPFRTRYLARHIVRAGLPVVPAAIEGTHRLWPPGLKLLDFSRLRLTLTAPVLAADADELLARAHAQVAAVLGRE
ncbi:MAG: 1-acyl-sn-glycerol-3-phosphate acyltransferase [Planctomycetes bacterium]|nr:1-acyl-sn-glycerol-3-phosphate acyltransferase [Planctomycetota bacterium]